MFGSLFLLIIVDFGLGQQTGGVVRFIAEPADLNVPQLGTAYFKCLVYPRGQYLTQWLKDSEPLERNSNHGSKVKTSLDNSTLLISRVSDHDSGNYQCVVKDGQGLELHSRVATLKLQQSRNKPVITHRPEYTEVKKGETISLKCGASGFPKPVFAWYKDGGRLSNAHDRFEIEEDGTLRILNAQLDDSAHYRCSATNYLGRASSAARVEVNLDIPQASPEFTSKPRDSMRQEGDIVEFTCVATGQPYPDITWWNNNRLVNSDGRITVSNGGQHLRLVDLRPYDSGLYVCRAENPLGRVEAQAALTVISEDQPLVLLSKPYDVTAPRGTTIQLPCRAQGGTPRPTITWFHESQQLNSQHDRSFRISPDGNLILFNVTQGQTGLYTCQADNGQDRLTATATVSLRSERKRTVVEEEVQNIAPIQRPRSRSRPPTLTSYDPQPPKLGDEFVLIALEEATDSVDKALQSTVEALFERPQGQDDSTVANVTAQSPWDLLRVFRYPPSNQREVARAAEIYERTLELVAQKVREGYEGQQDQFSYQDLVSPANLELIANISGCESHRTEREVNCEDDLCFHLKYRAIDGSCNNLQRPLWGASMTAFRRVLPAQYENGFNSPIGWDKNKTYFGFPKPGSRHVSNLLISSKSVTEDDLVSHMVMQWGQFLDHDLDHSMEAISRETFENGITCSSTCNHDPPCFPINIPIDDPRIASERCIEFTRSSAACGSGSTSVFFGVVQPREQLNQLTAFIDASQVYGSTRDLANNLRNLTNEFGRLREGPSLGYAKPLLPFNDGYPIDCRRDPTESTIGCFLAGDVRANEQTALLAMHTVWFRQHNHVASKLRDLNPHWSGDRLYEESRKILGAQMQHITFKHWLPLIVGPEGIEMLGDYKGYDANINPSISNVFASSAFRFGHTMVNPELARLGPNFTSIPEGPLALRQAFFAPWRLVEEGGVDPILRGLFASPAKKNMPHEVMSDELTERLFSVAHAVALDLGSINIQRGRDHGLPSYSDWREWCGFGELHSWEELAQDIPDSEVRLKLASVYGHPKNVDVWVGGLLEQSVPGGRVGRTVRCLLVEQFRRVRDGDRFWYESPSTFSPSQLDQIRQTSLSRILCDNGDDLARVTSNVFLKPKSSEEYVPCDTIAGPSLGPWFDCQEEEDGNPLSNARSRRHTHQDLRKQVDMLEKQLMDLKSKL